MSTISVEDDQLVVRLSRWGQLAALRGPVRVPLSEVRSVAVEPDPWSALRGIRSPGTGWPGAIAYGTWRMTGEGSDFNAVRGRGPAVRVDLAPGAPFSRLLVTVADPEATVDEIDSCRS